jgi:hypothetical protein
MVVPCTCVGSHMLIDCRPARSLPAAFDPTVHYCRSTSVSTGPCTDSSWVDNQVPMIQKDSMQNARGTTQRVLQLRRRELRIPGLSETMLVSTTRAGVGH